MATMKSWTRMTAKIARKTYPIEKDIFLFGIAIISSRCQGPRRMLQKSASRGRTVGNRLTSELARPNQKVSHLHRTRSSRRRETAQAVQSRSQNIIAKKRP